MRRAAVVSTLGVLVAAATLGADELQIDPVTKELFAFVAEALKR